MNFGVDVRQISTPDVQRTSVQTFDEIRTRRSTKSTPDVRRSPHQTFNEAVTLASPLTEMILPLWLSRALLAETLDVVRDGVTLVELEVGLVGRDLD